MKYVVISCDGEEMIFTFPKKINHDCMFEAITQIRSDTGRNWKKEMYSCRPISAGFISEGGSCYGYSESLGIGFRKDVDDALLGKS